MDYQIRYATQNDLKLVLSWAEKEGWNPGVYDAEVFYSADPNGFFIGYLGDRPISAISCVNYNDEFNFIGLYIVDPEFRGKGYGYQIWQHALSYIGSKTCGLDGVIAQQINYQRSRFVLAYRHIRYVMCPDHLEERNTEYLFSPEIVNWKELIAYDRQCFPALRENFLRAWLKFNTALIYIDHHEIRGYGVIRKCQSGYKVGPLFAQDRDIAQDILVSLVKSLPAGTKVYLDIPEINSQALLLVEYLKMESVFETARMYINHAPTIDVNKIFATTSLELG